MPEQRKVSGSESVDPLRVAALMSSGPTVSLALSGLQAAPWIVDPIGSLALWLSNKTRLFSEDEVSEGGSVGQLIQFINKALRSHVPISQERLTDIVRRTGMRAVDSVPYVKLNTRSGEPTWITVPITTPKAYSRSLGYAMQSMDEERLDRLLRSGIRLGGFIPLTYNRPGYYIDVESGLNYLVNKYIPNINMADRSRWIRRVGSLADAIEGDFGKDLTPGLESYRFIHEILPRHTPPEVAYGIYEDLLTGKHLNRLDPINRVLKLHSKVDPERVDVFTHIEINPYLFEDIPVTSVVNDFPDASKIYNVFPNKIDLVSVVPRIGDDDTPLFRELSRISAIKAISPGLWDRLVNPPMR